MAGNDVTQTGVKSEYNPDFYKTDKPWSKKRVAVINSEKGVELIPYRQIDATETI